MERDSQQNSIFQRIFEATVDFKYFKILYCIKFCGRTNLVKQGSFENPLKVQHTTPWVVPQMNEWMNFFQ